jgi:hypothetical protein
MLHGHETDYIGPIQTLTTSLAEMNEASLAFWLSKFVGGFKEFKVVCNQNERVVNPVFNNCNITFNFGK